MIEYTVEVSYSGGAFWMHSYYVTNNLDYARSVCDSLTKTDAGNIKTRIVKKEVIE